MWAVGPAGVRVASGGIWGIRGEGGIRGYMGH